MKPLMFWVIMLPAMMVAMANAAAAEPLERELYILVEVDAQQSWQGTGESPGHSEAESEQTYEVRLTLRSDGNLYPRNLLDPDLDARLKAKTIHLARKALQKMEAGGVTIPATQEERSALIRRMQEERRGCGVDPACRHGVSLRYAAILAAMQYPDALDGDAGTGRYRYFEPYPPDCASHWRVDMTLTIEGVRAGEQFSERRSAQAQGSSDGGVALCQRYLAVIDTQDQRAPLYLENFFLPSATGETVIVSGDGPPQRTIETQPMPSAVLTWVTAQLKHAPVSGKVHGTVPLTLSLNGISTSLGRFSGQAQVELTWRFLPPESAMPGS